MNRKKKWVRDGTIVTSKGFTEIDLRTTELRTRKPPNYDWITVKGATDASCERIARKLLELLNT